MNVLCKFSGVPAEPFSASAAAMQFGTSKFGVAHYWMEQSNGKLSFDVQTHGWHTLPQPRAYYEGLGAETGTAALMQDCLNVGSHEIPAGAYAGIIVNQPTSLRQIKVGLAIFNPADITSLHALIALSGDIMGYPRSYGTTMTSSNPWDSLSMYNETCSTVCSIPHVRADLKARQGWTAAVSEYSGTQSQAYTLSYLHLPVDAGTQHLVTTPVINGTYYTIEARHKAEDYLMPQLNTGGHLVIHRVDNTSAMLMIAMQSAQNSYIVDDHTIITLNSVSTKGLSITVAPKPQPTLTPLPTLTPQVTPTPQPSVTATPNPFTPQLLINASFEKMNLQGIPINWAPVNISNDKVVCNTETNIRAAEGACAFRFQGSPGESSMIWQRIKLAHLFTGRQLHVSMRSRSSNLQVGAVLQVTIYYVNAAQRPDVLILRTGPGYGQYRLTSAMLELAGPPAYADVKLSYKGQKGLLLVDDLSFTLR